MRNLRYLLAAVPALLLCSAQGGASPAVTAPAVKPAVKPVVWQQSDAVDLAAFNKDLVPGKPTIDVAVYVPSNFDPAFKKISMPRMIEGVVAAREIYARVGVQIRLVAAKTGAIDPRHLAIQANEIPRVPDTEYLNSYESSVRHPSEITQMALEAFESIVEPDKDNSRTIYLIGLQDVVFPFLELSEGRNWTIKMVRTGGLSFPSYSYYRNMPTRLRGVITITNLSTPNRQRRTIAHEIGHKVMNVSHEYKTTDPAHEVYAEGGLMLYGAGEDIPSGKEGRWHKERLLLSPYIYRIDANGRKQWNADYKDGGHYYDPLYGDKVVHFPGQTKMDPNW